MASQVKKANLLQRRPSGIVSSSFGKSLQKVLEKLGLQR